jgi:cyclopropane-fatty-acyl-phospholipid synthase
MATQEQMDVSYNYMDDIFRLSFGANADITCALYDGDFSKTLERAQEDKHEYVLSSINFRPGLRLLDIGSGWGPILKAAREKGGHGVGVTLSEKHASACQRNGLEAYVKDWKDIAVGTFGSFDGVVSLGAFEHFCSPEEYAAQKQDTIYGEFFKLCSDLLPAKGRLFLQTVTWGKHAPRYENVSVKADRRSSEYIVAALTKFFPGTWLPQGEQQILRVAEPYFRALEVKDGRRDYVQTTKEWDRIWKFSLRKAILALKLIPPLLRDRDFHYRLETLWYGYMRECLVREVMDHRRIVFEKK